jgi:DNA topoisomerase I
MTLKINLFNYMLYNQFGGKRNDKPKWEIFKHNGVLFPEPYKPHGIPILYDGKKIVLDPESEEYATIYAKFTETDYVKNKKFNKNFFNDWRKFLIKGGYNEIKDLNKIDFKLILNFILKNKEKQQNLSKEDKEKIKNKKDSFEEKYKYAYVDNKKEPVGNFRIEPPGIFLGRGCHPKAGKIKPRIYPEDITINIDKDSDIPELPYFYRDHKWGKIIHDNTLEWIASWKDIITGKIKYIWMGAKSEFKAKSDQEKFDLARKLKKSIMNIRKNNLYNITSIDVDQKTKQLATALYLIDKLALRVGNEKSKEEADTVGVCSLRVEHIKLEEDNKISLDFLGKDSIRYQNTVKIDEEVYKSLSKLIYNKKPYEQLFNLISPNMLNNYLKEMMNDLTAKVFRTYNASNLFQIELDNISNEIEKDNEDNNINLILNKYQKANVKVALLCNHQKNVSKTFNEQLNKLNDKVKDFKNIKKELENNKKELDNKKDKSKIQKINEKIKKMNEKIHDTKAKKDLKLELKNLSLTTSKINYIDPRITIAFFKKHNLPLDKIFSASLIDKFFWAMDINKDWNF